ncbi:MAG: BLUF domain-containing protein [Sphingobium sp.]|nr:BLUF domain-containing protein [Sphingobium sp.]
MSSIFQIIYISSATGVVTNETCRDIVRRAGINNARADVTGLLLFNGRRFLQALEGPQAAVESIFACIKEDERHRAIVCLTSREVADRQFGRWAMAYDDPADGNSVSLKDKVSHLLTHCDPSTRALFEGSAELHRVG